MKHCFKVLLILTVVAVLCSCLSCFVGCNIESPNKLKVEINGIHSDNLKEKDSNSWYTDINLEANTQITLYDLKGKPHTATVDESGNYTLILSKSGKSYNVEARKAKKAIIWVTALLSGGLYDYENEQNAWDPLPYEDITLNDFLDPETQGTLIGDLIARLLFGDENYPKYRLTTLLKPILDDVQDYTNFLWNVGLDNFGKPNNPSVTTANDQDLKAKYGVLNAYRPHAENIAELYGDDIDFHIYNYDWRFDCGDGAKKLEKYIDDNKFTDVLLYAHSMGGNVVASYLANSEYNRSRIVKYISVGGSFLGSFDVMYTMENMESYFTEVVNNLGLNEMLEDLQGPLKLVLKNIDVPALFAKIQNFVTNMESFVQLLPNFDLISGKQYADGGDGVAITIDGVPITNEDDLYAFYESRPWAWQRDENNEYVMNGDKHVLRQIVKDLKKFHYSQYVTLEDGSRVHSTTLVDTVYISGYGITSFCGVDVNTETNELNFRTTQRGDMQVLFYSSIVNLDENELREQGKLIEIENGNHVAIGCHYKLIKDIFLKYVYEFWGEPTNQIDIKEA